MSDRTDWPYNLPPEWGGPVMEPQDYDEPIVRPVDIQTARKFVSWSLCALVGSACWVLIVLAVIAAGRAML